MSKYGFNPDEVVTTKIDLIDKDGFHGVGEASGGGNGDGGSSSGSFPNCGIYISKKLEDSTDSACGVFAVARSTGVKTPLRFFSIYFGDIIPDSDFDIDGEMFSVRMKNDPLGTVGYDFNIDGIPDFIGDYIVSVGYYSDNSFSEVEPNLIPGTPVHAIFVCEDDNGSFFTVQAHDVVREID